MIRKVSSQRARKLRKLNEAVWWDTNLNSLVWEMKEKRHEWYMARKLAYF